MKHLTTSDKSLLIGDEAAELLIAYAALLGKRASADNVTLNAYGIDGGPVEVTFLLNSGSDLLIESSAATIEEPDNTAAIAYIRERIGLIESPPVVQPAEMTSSASEWED